MIKNKKRKRKMCKLTEDNCNECRGKDCRLVYYK